MARAYDTWDSIDRMNFNPDGSMKPEARQRKLAKGFLTESDIAYIEAQKMNEVRLFEEREQLYIERYGIPFSEWEKQGKMSQEELEHRQRKAILNGEEISSLPMDIDPDDYYEQVGSF
jgi:hypothetical protein